MSKLMSIHGNNWCRIVVPCHRFKGVMIICLANPNFVTNFFKGKIMLLISHETLNIAHPVFHSIRKCHLFFLPVYLRVETRLQLDPFLAAVFSL